MKRYYVQAQYTVNLYAYIDAENEEQAWDIAKELDGGEFKEVDGLAGSDWVVYDVTEDK